MAYQISKYLNLLLIVFLLLLAWFIALLFIVAPLGFEYQQKQLKKLLSAATAADEPITDSSLYPFHSSRISIQPFKELGRQHYNQVYANIPLYMYSDQSFESTSDWIITGANKQRDGEVELSLRKGDALLPLHLNSSLAQSVNPAYFQLFYYYNQSDWVQNYRALNRIMNNTSLYYIALEAAAIQESPEYFDQFKDKEALLEHYSLTEDQYSFLNLLVPMDPASWNSLDKYDYHVHSHSLIQYCLGEFPGRQRNLFALWKDAIDRLLMQTEKKTSILEEGCKAVAKGKRYLENLLCSQNSSDCRREIITALNYNITLNMELIKHVDHFLSLGLGIGNILQYFGSEQDASRILDILLKEEDGMINLSKIDSDFVRELIRDATYLNKANGQQIEQFIANYEIKKHSQVLLLIEGVEFIQNWVAKPANLLDITALIGQKRYLEDMEKYILHYVAQLYLNYASNTNRASIHSCSSFFSFFLQDISSQIIERICSDSSLDGNYTRHCFLEAFLFPSLYSCHSNFTPFLSPSTLQLVRQSIITPFEQFARSILQAQSQCYPYCQLFNSTCPPLVLALAELNTAALSMSMTQPKSCHSSSQPYSNIYSTVLTMPEPLPKFLELPHQQMQSFLSPWVSLHFDEMWEIFLHLIVPDPPQLFFQQSIFSFLIDPNALIKGYSPQRLRDVQNRSMLGIGNICAHVEELSFFPLSANITFSSSEDGIPLNIVKLNGRQSIEFLKYEVDETFQKCNQVWRSPLEGSKRVNGSLGYLIDLDSVQEDTIYIYNNYYQDVLKYDTFPCPHQAQHFIQQNMQAKCFILNTQFMRKDLLGREVHFLEREEAFSGSFVINLPGFCGISKKGLILPHFYGDSQINCFEQKYDEEHLSRSNWLVVDSVTGIVLYSAMNYTLSGIKPSSSLIPLIYVSEQIRYDGPVEAWRDIQHYESMHSLVFKVLCCLGGLTVSLTAWFVFKKVSMVQTKKLYQKLHQN